MSTLSHDDHPYMHAIRDLALAGQEPTAEAIAGHVGQDLADTEGKLAALLAGGWVTRSGDVYALTELGEQQLAPER
jgi:hypothetical protein